MNEKLFNTDSEILPKTIKDIFYTVLISAVLAFTVNIFHPKGFTFISTQKEKNIGIVYISSKEAKIKKDGKAALFLDSRQEDEYSIAHITGAVNIPAVPESVSTKKISENHNLIYGPVEIVIYCDGVSCGSSEILANRLIDMGYSRHIYIIKNGIPEWEENGFVVESDGFVVESDGFVVESDGFVVESD
ncbi:MAG: rhodanese-like domain-containing protein, partial [Spirochaetes bacterium]|nr:rhodanese-like domain-containing protein [Spirochaetota bacterium]